MIAKISCHKSTDAISVTEFFTGSLQIYSIVSSVVSLGWSFSTYEANQKKGALDFYSNPMARSIILMSALMQVSTIVRYILTAGICSEAICHSDLRPFKIFGLRNSDHKNRFSKYFNMFFQIFHTKGIGYY